MSMVKGRKSKIKKQEEAKEEEQMLPASDRVR